MNQTVTVCIPTFNEAENLRVLLPQLTPYYNVLVVDDSSDNTAQVAESLGATVLKGQHKGLGQAIVDGLKAAQTDIVVVCDGDGSHRPKDVRQLIIPLLPDVPVKMYPFVMTIGSRYVKGGNIPGWTFSRRLISRSASLLGWPITGLQDNTSGFFAIRKSAMNGAVLNPSSWKIMLEVLVKSRFKKSEVVEVPITFEDRQHGQSKYSSKQIWAYLKHLFLLAMFRFRVLNFMLVGGIGYLINMGLYWPLTKVFKTEVSFLGSHFYLPPFVLSSFVAICANYYLNKRWTFGDRKAKSLSFVRYLNMAGATLVLDMFVLFLLVDFVHLNEMLAAALAIALVFVVRYVIADKLIWAKK